MLVKICGLTRELDVQAAVAAGADAIGFVFTASPRRINADTARRLSIGIPKQVLRVGLFLNQDKPEIERIINSVELDLLQFHGAETESECASFGLPWLKAVAMENADSACQAERDFPSASGLLLDSHAKGGRGGSGKVFDWSLSTPVAKPIWLAGGLNADNVGAAIRIVRPYAVDVSSGVEAAPGIKDESAIKRFISAVRKIEYELTNGNQS